MGIRLEKIIKILGYSQKYFAESIGVKPAFINDIIKRDKTCSQDTLIKICKVHNVNLNWLLTCEGDMFIPPPSTTLRGREREFGNVSGNSGMVNIGNSGNVTQTQTIHNHHYYLLNDDESVVIDNLRKRKNADKMPIVKAVLGIK